MFRIADAKPKVMYRKSPSVDITKGTIFSKSQEGDHIIISTDISKILFLIFGRNVKSGGILDSNVVIFYLSNLIVA